MKGNAVFKSVLIATALIVQSLTVWQGATAQPMMQQRMGRGPDMMAPRFAPDRFNADRSTPNRFVPDQSEPDNFAQDQGQVRVQPSQAAMAAQAAYPGSVVLGVKLLPSGEYAVTLKIGGSVQRVMVNASNGQVS